MFEPCYSPNYQIIVIHGANRIEVQDEKGHKSVRRAGHVKRIEPVDKVCQQLPPEEVYKQFGRVSKLLLHPRDVPDIKLLKREETINCELENEGDKSTTLCELSEEMDTYEKPEKLINKVVETNTVHMTRKKEGTDENNSKELINQFRNKRPVGHTVKWTVVQKCMFPSNDSEESLNRLGDGEKRAVLSYGGKGSHTEMDTDSNEILSEKGQKSIIRCSTLKGNLQEMKLTLCIQGEYQSSEGISSKKSIYHTHQVEYYQGVKENPKTMIITLCEPQCKSSEKSIIQRKRSDKKQMDQMVTPVHIPACMCYQTDPNNAVAKRTDEINNVDLQ